MHRWWAVHELLWVCMFVEGACGCPCTCMASGGQTWPSSLLPQGFWDKVAHLLVANYLTRLAGPGAPGISLLPPLQSWASRWWRSVHHHPAFCQIQGSNSCSRSWGSTLLTGFSLPNSIYELLLCNQANSSCDISKFCACVSRMALIPSEKDAHQRCPCCLCFCLLLKDSLGLEGFFFPFYNRSGYVNIFQFFTL